MVSIKVKGYVLIEILIAMVILVALAGLLVPTLQAVQTNTLERQLVLQRIALEQAITEHLQAQLMRTGSFGCSALPHTLEIGDAQQPPNALRTQTLALESDWILATDTGLCSTYGMKSADSIEAQLSCDGLSTGDPLLVSRCDGAFITPVLSLSGDRLLAAAPASLADGAVLLATQSTFYWYLAPGKNTETALWRKPLVSGRKLELQPGIRNIRFYPILDRNQDGKADAVLTQPSQVSLQELSGLLIEYRYHLSNCDAGAQTRSYRTLRGDRWVYDGICSAVAKQLVALGG